MNRQLLPFVVTLGGLAAVFTLVLLFAFDPAIARPIELVVEQAPAVDIASGKRPSSIAPLSDRRAHPPDTGERPKLIHSAAYPYPVTSLEIVVNYAHDWVAGSTDPGATVAVTVTDNIGALKENAVVPADGSGGFFVDCGDWFSGQCPDIQPGDRVMVGAEGMLNEVSPVGSISGKLDAVENTVSGELNADWFPGSLEVRCEIWENPEPPPIVRSVDTNGGTFTCDFDDVGWDLEHGQTVALWYIEPDGDGVVNVPPWPQGRVNYAHDSVGVNYEMGYTFWLTVTDSVGAVKGTTMVETTSTGGWGAPGFDTVPEQWSPEKPDLMPGDWVYFAADDGYTNAIQVGAISGNVDVAADLVTGTVAAPGFGISLTIECHPWGAWDAGIDAPVKESFAEPDGSVPYRCAWDPATEWDMLPGQDIAVVYIEPDWDQIVNVVRDYVSFLPIVVDD